MILILNTLQARVLPKGQRSGSAFRKLSAIQHEINCQPSLSKYHAFRVGVTKWISAHPKVTWVKRRFTLETLQEFHLHR